MLERWTHLKNKSCLFLFSFSDLLFPYQKLKKKKKKISAFIWRRGDALLGTALHKAAEAS